MATSPLPAGHTLHEYRIDSVLGVGGFGITYLAHDRNLEVKVALKEYVPGDVALRNADHSIAPSSAEHGEAYAWGKRRFLDESRTIASLRHPNIVRVQRFFEANGTAYMVMEFVEGASLHDWVRPRRPLAQSAIEALVRPLLEGLEVVHRAGYMHRDIKPGNIYVREDASPVLLDFGSARGQSAEITAVVSPGYAPFEQYHTRGNQGPWSDLYALAGVLYWMITGQRPHEAAARVREDTMPAAVQAGDRSRYGTEFLAAIDWALATHERDRPQTVAEWRSALLSGTAAPQPEPTVRAAPPPPPAAAAPSTAPAPASTTSFDAGFLKSVEAELSQHLGPIAGVVVKQAARKAASQAALIEALSGEIADPGARAAFAKRFSEPSRPVSQPVSAQGGAGLTTTPPTALAATRFPLETLQKAELRLAEHIGPVARVVVKRAAMKARDEAELYLLIADEIEDREARKAFIRQAVSISGRP